MRKHFHNRRFATVLSALVLCVTLVNIILFMVDAFYYKTMALPEGKVISTSVSPNHKYEVSIYEIEGGGNLGSAVRAEVREIQTNETRNIYWEAGITKATVSWGSKNTVIINNHPINVINGSYDWRDDITSRIIVDNM